METTNSDKMEITVMGLSLKNFSLAVVGTGILIALIVKLS